MQALMTSEIKNPTEKRSESKIETRFYDELFKRLQDKNSEEFNDPEAVDTLYENIIDQISESPTELVKCLNSFHIDYFIHRSSLGHFLSLFRLLVLDNSHIEEYVSDRRISRAYEACLTCMGAKYKQINPASADQVALGKECAKALGNFLVKNFESIIDSENGIFTLRCFLRVIGSEDPLEQVPASQLNKNKKNKWQKAEFNIREVRVELLPEDWKLKKFLKKFNLSDVNLLEKGLLPAVSPCLTLLMRKLYASYPVASAELTQKLHSQFVKKASAFHSMIHDSIGSRFIESYLFTCPGDLLESYYLKEHLIENIHTYANYPVQCLIKHRLESEPRLVVLYEAIVENLDNIIDLHTDLTYKHYLIIELIVASSKNPQIKLDRLVKVLSTYFGCDNLSETDFIRALLVYEKLADILKDSPSIDQSLFTLEIKPIATQIVARLVEHNSKSVIKGFLGLTANELEHMCTNNVASHLIQECLRILGGKEKFEQLSQIYDKLKGRFLNLATNRSGSFVMETLWQTGNLKQRLVMVEELKVAEVKLKNDPIAKFLVNNMGVSFYKRKPEEWKQLQSAEMKKKQMLAELVGQADEELSEKKKKKRKWITDHE